MEKDKRPNTISPTLRFKKRYIAFEVIADKELDFQDLSNAIWNSALNFLGEKGVAESRMWVIKNIYKHEKKLGLIRCAHNHVEPVRAALAFVQAVNNQPVIVKVIGISGTIKAAKQKFFGERNLTSFT
jgi:ribonuclease P/MRP protein subunit POP5